LVISLEPWFLGTLLIVSVFAGATASIAGFGIGSLLTPLLAARLGVPLAVAAVAIPHALATALRWWRLRHYVDGSVLRSFGLLSAIGGLAGAFLYTRASSRPLTLLLAGLLLATALVTLFDLNTRWRPGRIGASALGLLSGFFGGAAGNQGGLRAAALLSFSLMPTAFVATSTAVGLIVDAVRLPVYVWTAGAEMASVPWLIAVASAGVIIGTLFGERLLFGLSPALFRRFVALLIGALAFWLALQVW
jgi:uncharacterized membrane protein YfcA